MLITPRPGADRNKILKTLQQIFVDASNLLGAGPSSAYQRLLNYLEWVTGAVRLLQDQVSEKDVDRLIQTRRYHALLGANGMLAGTAQERLVNGLVDQELTDRAAALREAMTTLHEHIARWSGPAWLVVADSSFYLNSPLRLAETDLHATLGLPAGEAIHLLFPIVIVDELDRLKESGNNHPRWRAGHTLGCLEVITSGTIGTLRRGGLRDDHSVIGEVEVEIVLDQPGHIRQPIADDEIIERAATIQAIAGREVRLLTCDTGQATRGRMAGLRITKLPSDAGTGAEPARPGTGGRADRKRRQEAQADKATRDDPADS